ncbi:MAG: hypothetical protein KatS3mg045_1382 [Bellilinea sp.]|nr:MAG: hypothetical protein KatS3mg045_1382 [Bellilinea sp.]
MSGPKKADVEAQLSIARDSQRKSANLLADMEESAIASILHEVDNLLNQAVEEVTNLHGVLEALSDHQERMGLDVISSTRDWVEQVQHLLDEARIAAESARRKAEEAEHRKQRANETFARGEEQYQRAAEANRRLDPHDRRPEMEWAKQARVLFDQAAAELAAAAQARKEAERVAVEALKWAIQARSTAANGSQQAHADQSEAEAWRRAEEEARRIASQHRQAAVLAVEQARVVFNRLNGLPHGKFCPGEGERIQRRLEEAIRHLNENRLSDAAALARSILDEVRRLEQMTRKAQQEFERQLAETQAEIEALAAAIQSADPGLIGEWADDPQALDNARRALQSAERAMAAEHYPEARQQARAAQQALAQALHSAAENKSADEKRKVIGQAVMSVLEELGFDVSFEPGSRDEPMRISGQTPDVSGKGDFDVALPLEGEVHFEINTPPGDTTCIAAVEELQKRLAERGVHWNTTDWGHAAGADAVSAQQKMQQTEKQKVKSKY